MSRVKYFRESCARDSSLLYLQESAVPRSRLNMEKWVVLSSFGSLARDIYLQESAVLQGRLQMGRVNQLLLLYV